MLIAASIKSDRSLDWAGDRFPSNIAYLPFDFQRLLVPKPIKDLQVDVVVMNSEVGVQNSKLRAWNSEVGVQNSEVGVQNSKICA
ncbi:hypothetical protein NIES2109_19300 [Nostoc sp. HK-01]|nr:hypothetical protein NIES2109_19300 [Nostoc sp. HK-01]